MAKIDEVMFNITGFPGYCGDAPKNEAEYNALFNNDNPWPNKPTWQHLELELAKLNCKTKRAAEYPPMADYLDGIVKGDQAQVQAYIDACLAIKAKYPKP
jgi:hypothetical protein